MTVYTIKMHCNGAHQTIFYEYGVDHSHTKRTISSFDELRAYVLKYYGLRRYRLAYLNTEDASCGVNDESTLYYAVTGAPGGVLVLKVTPREKHHRQHHDHHQGPMTHHHDHHTHHGDDDRTLYEAEPLTKRRVSREKLARRFSVHHAQCYRCLRSPIHGVCYRNGDYNLCYNCTSSTERHEWHAHYYPWHRSVPRAPLANDDYSVRDEVRHLQKILTELGYMTLDDTTRYQGSFQGRTANAVEAFRKQYRIYGGDMTVYDRHTEHRLADVLREHHV